MEFGDLPYDTEQHEKDVEYLGWGELALSQLTSGEEDALTCVRFDAGEEGLWTGSACGVLSQATLPSLSRHAYTACHEDAILSLRSMGHGCISLSASQLCLHFSGCLPRLAYLHENADLAAVEFEYGQHRVLLGHASGGVTAFDLVSGRAGSHMDTSGQGIVAMAGPLSRGGIAIGTVQGRVGVLDARAGRRITSSLPAHNAGFAALDATGDLIATAGFAAQHGGRVSIEPTVKIFDVRMGLRMLNTLPFAAGPAALRFHPVLPTSLLIAGSSGVFATMDATGLSMGNMHGIDTGGDAITCCDISPSGECLSFGGGSGYVHVWAESEHPAASMGGEAPLGADVAPSQAPSLGEDEPFSKIPTYYPSDGGHPASFIGPKETMRVGLTPRIVDEALLASGKRSDFVTYVPNPKKERGMRTGQAAAAVAALREARLRPPRSSQNADAARAARAAERAAAGGIVLPGRYRRVAIKQQTSAKFEEFDFSYWNKTPFPGLENGLANCYVNALLQVLFFIRPMRDLGTKHAPDPDAEFSLIGELSLLFRMLATAGGVVCQASNLLRALRQSREAVALGLVEGVRGERGSADIEVEAQKDKSLARRTQRLLRFVMEQLNKELVSSSTMATKMVANSSITHPYQSDTTRSGLDEAPPASLATSPASQDMEEASASTANETAPLVEAVPAPSSEVERIFAVIQQQRTRCLSRPRPDQFRHTRAFQVDLQYPSVKDRPPLPPTWEAAVAAGAGPLQAVKSTSAMAPKTSSAAGPSSHALATAGDGGPVTGRQGWSPSPLPPRPSFATILASSLRTSAEMRAWFDPEVTYQYVRQERMPLRLPQVLVVSCALQERADLAWWQPVHAISKSSELGVYNASRAPSFSGGDFQGVDGGVCGREGSTHDDDEDKEGNGGKPRATSVSWLPLAVCIAADPEAWLVHVAEGATPEEAEAALSTEATSESNSAMAARATYSLTAVVAHVVDQDEAAEAGPEYEGHMVAHIKVPQTYFAAQTESPIVSRPSSRGKGRDADALQSVDAAADAAADATSHIEEGKKRDVPQRDVVDDEVDGDGGVGDFGEYEEENKQTPVDFDVDAVGSTEHVDVAVLNAATPDKTAHNNFAASSHRAAKESISTRQEGWMVFNDFHITPCLPQEVLELYGGQKAPALLFFTRIDVETAAAAAVPASPTPALSPDAFLSLCRAPPIQSNTAHLRRPVFVPLRADELPKPGTMLALDAEFVAYSPPERIIRCGLEVEARPSRLGLGRVSIVRGEGPLAGVPCIDDYIRSVEPVYDHLTRFSGLVPGDLDPSRSRHYLTTLRKAYLKLRFLVDAGVVFVGHGLKKDFRMLNIVVPPEQMVDTLDLFYTGRGRRVSLRFLSAYLLGSAIQSGTHDSVEDATTALRLYQTYRALVAEGKFETVLTEMFEWGATAGWDPDTWQNSPPYLTASMQQVTEGAGMGRAPGETAGFQNATPEGALQRLEAMQQQLATQRRNE